jgi:patatin-like phospholipase/acyl hydrolase
MPEPKFFRILSIDGGGIRGLILAQILTVVEAKLKAASHDPDTRIADWFDLIAGTSTGGILTCIYLCPGVDDPNRPRFSAAEAVELYMQHGHEIFDITFWQKVKSAEGYLDEKYPSKGLETVLVDYLHELKLSELVKPCLVTAYDIENRAAYFFAQHDARKYPGRNFKVREVARATSAAPTFFECARVESETQVSYSLIDGGLFANNPALCAYAEARKMGSLPTAKEMVILSLGTGDVRTPYYYNQVKDWGGLGWVRPVIDILMSGTVEVADYQLRQMYKAVGAPEQYLRIQSPLAPQNADIGNSEPANLHELVETGEKAAEQYDAALDAFVALLLAEK